MMIDERPGAFQETRNAADVDSHFVTRLKFWGSLEVGRPCYLHSVSPEMQTDHIRERIRLRGTDF